MIKLNAQRNSVVKTLTITPFSSVTVPFLTAVEANIACRTLASNVQHQQMMVQQEFTVNDTILTVSVLQEFGVRVVFDWEAMGILGAVKEILVG